MRFPTRLTVATSVLAALLAALASSNDAAAQGNGALNFRVGTFNICFDFPDAPPLHRWAPRADLVPGLILASKASVFCLQEDKPEQIDDLKKRMPGWDFEGRGRNENASGERCSVAFDTSVWKCVDHGDLALSDTPEKQGSNTWGCKYPHKVTWAVLEAQKDPKHRQVMFMSTHFDEHPEMDDVRKKSAQVIRNWLEKHAKAANVVVCGDFNSAVTDASHAVMTDTALTPLLRDVWDVVRPPEVTPGTVHEFTGTAKKKRIDWILTAGKISPVSIHIDRWSKDGHWPSDHFAVEADLEVASEAVSGSSKKKDYVEPQVK